MSGAGAASGGRGGHLPGIAWFLAAVLAFGIMDAMIKQATAGYDTWQIMFFRAAFSMLPVAVLVRMSGGVGSLRTKRLSGHLLRSLIGFGAVFCFFHSFRFMPLADVYAVGFAAPLFLTALSVPILGEAVGWRRWSAVLVGFAGVLVMLRPGQGVLTAMALLPLAGAFLYAIAMLYVRILSRTETNAAIVFYFLLTVAVLSGVAMVPVWRTPDLAGLVLLALIGIVGGFAQIAFTQAFRLAPPALLAPFEYTGMIWAVSFGYVFFGDVPDMAIWVGGAIVIASGLYIIHREAARAPAVGGHVPEKV